MEATITFSENCANIQFPNKDISGTFITRNSPETRPYLICICAKYLITVHVRSLLMMTIQRQRIAEEQAHTERSAWYI